MPQPYTGGCACGAIRYSTPHAPVFQNHYQCRDCQWRSGSGHGSWLTFAAGSEMTLGGKAEIDLPEGTQHGKTFRLRGKGIKGVRSSYPGDLYCHVSIETPIKLTEHQRKLLKELDESFRKAGDRHSPNAKTWSDRVKDLFKA